MCDTCGDNRFELIEKYKQKLIESTNISDSPEEMAVIDNILFRFWQMGWLKGELFGNSEQLDCSDCVNHGGDWDCDHLHCHIGTGTITDSISRAAVLDEIHKYMEERDYTIGTLYDNICEMPSVQPVAKDINVPVNDCISRARAIETVRKAKSIGQAHRMLVQLPSAQPRWIPCSERMPKKAGDYLVTTHSGQIARYIYLGNDSSKEYWMRCAIAWMPLPKPWEGGRDGTD